MMFAYVVSLVFIPVSLIAAYFLTQPDYMLNDNDTKYKSLAEVFFGLGKLASGTTWLIFNQWMQTVPFYALFLPAILYLGILAAILPLFLRLGRLTRVDARFGILILGCFSVYTVVSPTNYAPRFSTFLLPIVCMSIFYTLSQLIYPKEKKG
jgi:hypothetical protein